MTMSDLPHATEPAASSAIDSETPCGKTAGRPRAIDMEVRNQHLLETAGQLFIQKGYSKVSLEMIAREAHVAVRTIYVKFGGKAGLFNAVIASGRSRYFPMADLDTDQRPLEQILGEFGLQLLQLLSHPHIISLQRMVIAEAGSNPELARTYDQAGPGLTRELLNRFFARADIKVRFRDNVPRDTLSTHLLNCIMGDRLKGLMFEAETEPSEAELRHKVALGLDLFFNGTLGRKLDIDGGIRAEALCVMPK